MLFRSFPEGPLHMLPVQMVEALDWCLRLGITTVSVYAFSIENFRREPSEVALLMQLAEQKLDEILQVNQCPLKSHCLNEAWQDIVDPCAWVRDFCQVIILPNE